MGKKAQQRVSGNPALRNLGVTRNGNIKPEQERWIEAMVEQSKTSALRNQRIYINGDSLEQVQFMIGIMEERGAAPDTLFPSLRLTGIPEGHARCIACNEVLPLDDLRLARASYVDADGEPQTEQYILCAVDLDKIAVEAQARDNVLLMDYPVPAEAGA